MISGIGAVYRKEWKEFRSEFAGKWSDLAPFFMGIGMAGVFLPLVFGPALLMPGGMAAMTAVITGSFTSSLAGDSMAGERERKTIEVLLACPLSGPSIVLGKIAAMVSFGLLMGGLFLTLAYGTLMVLHPQEVRMSFSWITPPAALFFSLTAATLVAAMGAWASLRAPSVKQAQQTLGLSVMVLLIAPVFALQVLPQTWTERLEATLTSLPGPAVLMALAGLMVVLDLLAIWLVLTRFRRSDLLGL